VDSDIQRFIAGGQSLEENLFTAIEDNTPAGAESFIDIADNTLTGTVMFGSGATGGAYASKAESSDANELNYFYNPATGLFEGTAAINWLRAAQSLGGVCRGITWDQGQASAIGINAGRETKAEYKAVLLLIFTWMRGVVGSVPIIISPIGRRSDSAAYSAAWQSVREAELEVAAENSSYIKLAPDYYDLAMYDETGVGDGVHISKSSSIIKGQREARSMLAALGESVTAFNPPTITNVSRTGAVLTITLTHASGTDFAPTTGISGFYFTDNGASIAILTAVRTNATTVTVTLASTPTGTKVLYYGYGIMQGITVANILKDNSANTLPLRAYVSGVS
jgi:hypothetical protein